MLNRKTYLLIPSVPTPNGRLHLGHIGGPYLSADILARYLRLCGHQALMITGTDSFESYVTAQAVKEQSTPEAICHSYHSLIADDLNVMDIQVDQFVNPLDKKWKPLYQQWHEKTFQKLLTKGVTSSLKENVFWDEQQKRYLTGCWLKGNCPFCKAKISGYFCEDCGGHFRPEEVIRECDYTQKQVENIFLRLPISYDIQKKGINKNIEAIFQNFLKQQNNLFRLTANSDWGLPHNGTGTLFNYGFMFAYFLMFGEIAAKLLGTDKNVFAKDSSVVTISSFGIDNAVPFLSSSLGISAACEEYKPFDYYVVNYFYYLDGSKFSTSRRHAIWVDDVIKQNIFSDIVRLYLTSINVRQKTGHFISSDFIKFYNETVDWIEQFIFKALQLLPEVNAYTYDSHLKQQFFSLFAIQERALQVDNFLPHIAVNAIGVWLKQGKKLHPQSDNYFWWLKALTLFIYPFMPKLGEAIWKALGYQYLPSREDFFAQPTQPLQRKLPINIKSIVQTLA